MSANIGILGGTFNPVHLGHLIFAENAWEQFHLDTIWMMPNDRPPHKQDQTILPAIHRIRMLEAAIRDNPHLTLSSYEIGRKGLSYTAGTLLRLKEDFPETNFSFLIGADSLFQIETWKDPAVIMSHCRLLAARRDSSRYGDIYGQADYLRQKYHADISFVSTPEVDISSQLIRTRAAAGLSIRYLVPGPVEEYIRRYQLYQDDLSAEDAQT